MTARTKGNRNADVPGLRTFFLAHGAGIGERRTVRPYLEEVFLCSTLWMAGRLPGGKTHLAVSIPPGHGKTYTARDTIAYGLGLWPDSWWLYTSYAEPLAVEQTMNIKRALDSEWYRRIFPWAAPTTGTRELIRTAQGGMVYGVGAGGTITGFRGGRKREHFSGGIVIDDPLKAAEARSAAARKNARDWFTGTVLNRRNRSDTPILLIAQRLHPEDLTGFLKTHYPEDWHFLDIPAIAPGAAETIWPETFSYPQALKLRAVDPFTFHAQYQQEPIVPGGAMIKEEWWRYYDDPDAVNRKCDVRIVTADTAYGVKDANDYSVFQCWGFEGNRRAYLLDQVRGKWGYERLLEVACDFWEKHREVDARGRVRPVCRMYIENRASGQSLVQQHDLFREKGVNAFPWNAGQRDKVARVKECLPSIYAGRVALPDTAEASWVDDFIAECAAFSEDMSQTHDDQVDAMTMAILLWRGELGGLSE